MLKNFVDLLQLREQDTPFSRSRLCRYTGAILSVLVVFLARLALDPILHTRVPFLLFIIAVTVAAWYGGFGPGIMSLVLSVLLGDYFFATPRYHLFSSAFRDGIPLIFFFFCGTVISQLSNSQARMRMRAEAHAQALLAQQSRLQKEIEERTRAEQRLIQQRAEIEGLNVRLRRAMQETHHRVKNNLQAVVALAEMQLEPNAKMISSDAMRRITQHVGTLARLHDLLTQEAKTSESMDTISSVAMLERLIPLLQAGAGSRPLSFEVEEVRFSITQGASVALLISEQVSNAIKHGAGGIHISLKPMAMLPPEQERRAVLRIRLEVSDEGKGFPPNFNPKTDANTGLDLIDSIGHLELRGRVTYANRPEGGASVVTVFPLGLEEAEDSSYLDGGPFAASSAPL